MLALTWTLTMSQSSRSKDIGRKNEFLKVHLSSIQQQTGEKMSQVLLQFFLAIHGLLPGVYVRG